MIRKITMLVGMAVAASAFSASPAAAVEWGHGEAPLGSSATVEFSGSQTYNSGVGGITCSEVKETAKLIPSSEGEGTALGATLSSCKGNGGLAGCTITLFQPTVLPFAMNPLGKGTIGVTGKEFDVTLHGAFCPYHTIKVKGEFCYTLTKTGKLGPFSVSGSAQFYNGTTGALIGNATPSGSMNTTPNETYELL